MTKNDISDQENAANNMKRLSPQQKKTIREWIRYLGVAVLKAVIAKMSGGVSAVAVLSAVVICGCQEYPEVYVTKQWEGHYMNTDDFYSKTVSISLENGESIWVLSNRSLLKVIENSEKGK